MIIDSDYFLIEKAKQMVIITRLFGLKSGVYNVIRETIKRFYRVNRRDIAYLRFIFEAYDGLAIIETQDPESGVLIFHIAPGCETDVETVLADLKRDILMERINF